MWKRGTEVGAIELNKYINEKEWLYGFKSSDPIEKQVFHYRKHCIDNHGD